MLKFLALSVTVIAAVFSIAILIVIVMRDKIQIAQAVKLCFVIVVAVLPEVSETV